MIKNYNEILKAGLPDLTKSVFNIFENGDVVTPEVVEEIIKIGYEWALRHSWLKYPDEIPPKGVLCLCKISLKETPQYRFDVATFDSTACIFISATTFSKYRDNEVLAWQPLNLESTSSGKTRREVPLRFYEGARKILGIDKSMLTDYAACGSIDSAMGMIGEEK